MPKPWYEAAFGADYLERYAHRDQSEADAIVARFIARTALSPDATVLDLCCGAGRHVRALERCGCRVVGLDLSRDLLESAAERTADGEGSVLVRADKRRLPLADMAFDAVTHFFTAFGYFPSDAENFAVFAEIARVLRTGGWYLFDFLDADRVRAELASGPVRCREEEECGTSVETTRRLSPDGLRVEKHVRFLHDDRVTRELVESVRLFTPAELRSALGHAGFSIEEEWGSYAAVAPGVDSCAARWIALSRKR